MDINEAREFLKNRINPNMVETVLNAAIEEGKQMGSDLLVIVNKIDGQYSADKEYSDVSEHWPHVKLINTDDGCIYKPYFFSSTTSEYQFTSDHISTTDASQSVIIFKRFGYIQYIKYTLQDE